MSYQDQVPSYFFKAGEKRPEVETVGDLKARLEELPDDLPVGAGFCTEGAVMRVYNVNRHDAHLALEEWDEDDD